MHREKFWMLSRLILGALWMFGFLDLIVVGLPETLESISFSVSLSHSFCALGSFDALF